jgi:hypothetical protein
MKIINLIFVLILTGCASAPPQVIAPFDKTRTHEGSFDDAWRKLVAFVSTNDAEVGTIEKDSGLITLKGDGLSVGLTNTYCDFVPGFLMGHGGGGVKGSILMTDDDGFVTTTVNVKFHGIVINSLANPPSRFLRSCNSKGVLETAILNAVD